MAGLGEFIDDIRRRVTDGERRRQWQSRTGVVAQVDPVKGLARVRLQGDDDEPFLTPWIPWSETSAGENKTHNPPSEGQQVKIESESGDLHDAVIKGSLNSSANGRPSAAGNEYVLGSVGEARLSITGGGSAIVARVGGVTATLTASGLAIVGGTVTHNGVNIGDTHKHAGVEPGPAKTQTPS